MDPKILYTIIGLVIAGMFAGLVKLIPVIAKAAKANGQAKSPEQAPYTPSRMRCVNMPEIKQALTNNQIMLQSAERTEQHIELIKEHAIKQTGIEEQMLNTLKEIAENGKT